MSLINSLKCCSIDDLLSARLNISTNAENRLDKDVNSKGMHAPSFDGLYSPSSQDSIFLNEDTLHL